MYFPLGAFKFRPPELAFFPEVQKRSAGSEAEDSQIRGLPVQLYQGGEHQEDGEALL